MIRISVDLHSARTGLVTSLGVLEISNDGTGDERFGNYTGKLYRKGATPHALNPMLMRGTVQREGRVRGHARKGRPVWILVLRMLRDMFEVGRV